MKGTKVRGRVFAVGDEIQIDPSMPDMMKDFLAEGKEGLKIDKRYRVTATKTVEKGRGECVQWVTLDNGAEGVSSLFVKAGGQ